MYSLILGGEGGVAMVERAPRHDGSCVHVRAQIGSLIQPSRSMFKWILLSFNKRYKIKQRKAAHIEEEQKRRLREEK